MSELVQYIKCVRKKMDHFKKYTVKKIKAIFNKKYQIVYEAEFSV